MSRACLESWSDNDATMYEVPITAEAKITRIIRENLYELELPNGKLTTGHLSKALRARGIQLDAKQVVKVEMTPFDFETARITEINDH